MCSPIYCREKRMWYKDFQSVPQRVGSSIPSLKLFHENNRLDFNKKII